MNERGEAQYGGFGGWSKCLVLWAILVDTFEECQLGSSSWPDGNGLDVTRHTAKDVGLFQSSKNT